MERPTSVMVFAILNIVFGIMGMCYNAFSMIGVFTQNNQSLGIGDPAMEEMIYTNIYFHGWQRLYALFSLLNAGILIAAGIGLLNMKDWGRKLSLLYAWVSVVLGLLSVILLSVILLPGFMQQNASAAAQPVPLILGFFGGLGCCMCMFNIYPMTVIGFMSRASFKAYFLETQPFYDHNHYGGGY